MRLLVAAALGIALSATLVRGAMTYPMTIVADATATNGDTSINSKVTIHVEELLPESRRTKVVDGLKYNGYQGFMNAMRPLPALGTIQVQNRKVDVRYAWETNVDQKHRLVLVSDKPLFFLAADASKSRTGYELTVVDLLFDEHGAATGSLAGAARVKPTPDGGVVLDDYAVAPVTLHVAAPAK
jgi:hypothetical protein